MLFRALKAQELAFSPFSSGRLGCRKVTGLKSLSKSLQVLEKGQRSPDVRRYLWLAEHSASEIHKSLLGSSPDATAFRSEMNVK